MGQIPDGVPTTTLEVGGREYQAVYTMGTARRLRRELRKLGVDVDDPEAIAAADEVEVSFLTLWAMIAHGKHAGMTPDDLADSVSVAEVNALIAHMEGVMAESQVEEKEPGKPAARRTKGKRTKAGR